MRKTIMLLPATLLLLGACGTTNSSSSSISASSSSSTSSISESSSSESSSSSSSEESSSSEGSSTSSEIEYDPSITLDYDGKSDSYDAFAVAETDGFTVSDNTYTFTTASGEYNVSGYLDGQLIVAADDVTINLNGVYLENTAGLSPIASLATEDETADYDLNLKSGKGSVNYVISDSKNPAIASDYKVEFGGSGTLVAVGTTKHGIKVDKAEIKGSGTYYIQGSDSGSAINCNDFEVGADKTFNAYLINSKNGIKADNDISIASGNFHLFDLGTALKTDLFADDSVAHSISILSGASIEMHAVDATFESDTVSIDDGATVLLENEPYTVS